MLARLIAAALLVLESADAHGSMTIPKPRCDPQKAMQNRTPALTAALLQKRPGRNTVDGDLAPRNGTVPWPLPFDNP